MADRRPSFARTSNALSKMPVRVPPGPVDAEKLLFGALMSAAKHRGGQHWVADHEPLSVAVSADGVVSVSDLADAVRRLSAELRRLGLTRGDWCVVWLEQPLDVMLAVTALTGIGAVPVALSPKLAPALAAESLRPVPHTVALLSEGQRHADVDTYNMPVGLRLAWEEVTAAARGDVPDRAALPDSGVVRGPADPYVVTHTSGTTGMPKLTIHTVRSFFEQADMQRKVISLLRFRGYLAVAISPVHVRTLTGVLGVLLSRAPIAPVICKAQDSESIGRMLRRWRPGYLETHPNTFVLWEGLADSGAMESVRVFLATFDASHPRTIERLLAGSRQRTPMFVELYAQSECGPLASRIWLGGQRRAGRRLPALVFGHGVGWSVPGYSQVRVVDEHGSGVARGQQGRIVARTRGRFGGYLNLPELFTENLSADGWWDTGDQGALDRRGQLHLLDRQVERLSRARSAVALEDILLQRLPELTEAIVMEIGDCLVPVIASHGNVPVDEAKWANATRDLPALSRPELLDWDDIPRTATGKVRRKVLLHQIVGVSAD
jgi:acyl-coenzyme A synthetase/AMP-(fatty) acid ligase